MLKMMDLLREIQELDKERYEVEEQLRQYPALWSSIKKKLAEQERELKAAEQAESEFHKIRHRFESEIRVGRDLRKRYESQVSLIRTQREVTALSSQMDQTRQRVAKLEAELAILNEREPGLTERKKQAKAAFEETRVHAREERERIRQQIAEKKARLAEIEAARKRLAPRVAPELLSRYDILSRRWPGSVLVTVRNGSCQGCHMTILPQKMVVIHKGEEIAQCDNCGRLLSHDEDYQPAGAAAEAAE